MPRSPHPFLFFLLILPYGTSFGYVSVAFPYIATHGGGVTPEQSGAVVAAAFVPHVWKFLWAPVVDTTLSKRAWYAIALALVCGGTVSFASIPITAASLGLLTAVVVASQVGLTLMGMACENFLAHLPDEVKGRAAGWYQAGSWVGVGVGGGAALWLAQRLPAGWMVGAILGIAMLASAAPLIWLPSLPATAHRLVDAMIGLGRDIKLIVTSRTGILGMLICLSPVGAGAASNYFGPIADDWHASADTVALVSGVLGGLIAAAGAMAGGWLADRMNRRLAYAIGGGLCALTGVAMALAPHSEWTFIVFTSAYGFFNGASSAAFTGFVLETIGKGAVATKYNIFAGLANQAINYSILFDGHAHTTWGADGMLLADAALTGAGIVALVILIRVLRPREAARETTPAAS